MGTEVVRMDTSVPISPEGLRQAELAANRIVWQDVPVLISYPTREDVYKRQPHSRQNSRQI